MDDPRSFLDTIDPFTALILDHMLYCNFIQRGLYQTAEVFRQETGAQFLPVSSLSPTEDDVPGGISLEQLLVINEAGQAERITIPDDDGSSYRDEDNMWQQSGLTPSGEHESNEQIVEGLTLDDIFDNQGLASVVEACQSSKMASNECGVEIEEDVWDFSITDDLIELSTLFNGKKNEEGDSCSQDAYNGEIQGVTVGGNLVLRTMPHLKILMVQSSTPANIMVTDTPGSHSVAQPIPRTTETASNESGRKRRWFEVSGDGEGDYSTKSAHSYKVWNQLAVQVDFCFRRFLRLRMSSLCSKVGPIPCCIV
ncbi:hypothetical protein L1987_29579 [Smallanthus sonchifolius]|uniref:Uncharacterized protein n=1 Tax=Smallanthus sonchifolius TaxID=185202 RepID=A0ACB9HZW8_9ASTR|nr:hypothetical protein L1987_29579 [Smallanthus sonchifolius]